MNATKVVLDWIAAHLYQIAFPVVSGVIISVPAVSFVPFLAALGFGANGPIAGSAAASIMSYFGTVPARGLYAIAQSAAMGGYGARIIAVFTQVGTILSFFAAWVWGRNNTGC